MHPLVQRVRGQGRRAFEEVGRRYGFDVVKSGPFSPVPQVPAADDPVWSQRLSLSGVELDLDAQLELIAGPLHPYIEEFARDVRGGGYELWNGLYQAGDAELLYALVRQGKPRQILEIGSGNSTLVSAAACVANARDGWPTELVAVDPAPRRELRDSIDGLARVELRDCREIPLERFESLAAGDILFVDTTHVMKLGSEVNWLVLEVLPRLQRGVRVHFHDIFLPHEYPHYIFLTAGHLNEQYLLAAVLIGGGYTVTLAPAALFIERHARLVELIPSLGEHVPGLPEVPTWLPSSFWIERA